MWFPPHQCTPITGQESLEQAQGVTHFSCLLGCKKIQSGLSPSLFTRSQRRWAVLQKSVLSSCEGFYSPFLKVPNKICRIEAVYDIASGFFLLLSCGAVTLLINWIPSFSLCKSFLLPISRAAWDLCYVFTHLTGILFSLSPFSPLLLFLSSVKGIRRALAPRAYIVRRPSCILLHSTLCVTAIHLDLYLAQLQML